MGILRATKYKTLLKLSAAVFVLSAVLVANLSPLSASAASLSFSWKDSQTVAVSGPVTGNLVSKGSGSTQFQGSVTGTTQCNLLNVTVDSTNTTATLDSRPTGQQFNIPGDNPCYADTFGITAPQPISGTRPTSAANETTAQQSVQVFLQSNLNKDASPSTVKFTVKNSSDKVVSSPTVSKTVSATSGVGSANSSYLVDYRYTFTLNPGTYNICFNFLDSTCHSFTKIKYQNLTETYGTLGAYNFINVTISSDAAQSAASTWTVSAQNVLLKQNGKTIQTVVAPQYTHNAVINDQSGGGTGTVTVSQQAQFKNVSPGTYSICLESNNSCVDVVKVADQKTIPDPIVISIAASIVPDSVGDPSNLMCQKSFTNPLTWLVCPMVAAANEAVQAFDGQITCLMQVDLTDVFGNGSNDSNPYKDACGPKGTNVIKTTGKTSSDAYYAAWNTFRSFALALMVIAGLVMVISQAAGFELLDAYTVRKVLPRLLIAGIGITLSWQLMQFLIEITNTVGFGIRDIIYFPFKAFGSSNLNGVGTSILASTTFIAGMAIYGLPGIAMLLLTALLGVIVAFVTLVLRKLVIIFLLMMAPLAIACYILPNTQKYWKMWWDTLAKALLVFPIIAGMIAIGHVFATTTFANSNSVLSQIIAVIAYFLPYFLIPTAVKMAGGAMGAIASMVNNRAQGGFGMLRKQRAGITERRRHNAIERAKEGNIFKTAPENSRRGKFNRGVKATTKLGQVGLNPLAMRSKLRTAINDSSETGVGKVLESEEAKAIFGNDSTVWASRFGTRDAIMAELERQDPGTFGGNAGRIAREDAAAQILRAQSKFGNEEFQRARLQAQGKTGTGYVRNGKFDAAMVIKDINDTYGSDRNGANRALARIRSSLGESGQVAGVAGFGTWSKQLEDSYRNPSNLANAHRIIMDDAIDSATPSQALYGKKSSAAAMGEQWAVRIKAIADERIKPENQNQQAQAILDSQLSAAMSSAAGIYDAISQASPQNASAMANELMGVKLENGPGIIGGQPGQQFTIREYIQSQMDSNPEFVNRRRDITQSTYDQAQRELAASQRSPSSGMPTPGTTSGGMPGIKLQ